MYIPRAVQSFSCSSPFSVFFLKGAQATEAISPRLTEMFTQHFLSTNLNWQGTLENKNKEDIIPTLKELTI